MKLITKYVLLNMQILILIMYIVHTLTKIHYAKIENIQTWNNKFKKHQIKTNKKIEYDFYLLH